VLVLVYSYVRSHNADLKVCLYINVCKSVRVYIIYVRKSVIYVCKFVLVYIYVRKSVLVYKCTEVVFVCTQVCTYMYVCKSVRQCCVCMYVISHHVDLCLKDKLPTCLLFTLVLTSNSTLDLCYSG